MYSVPVRKSNFEELCKGIVFDDIVPGRNGAILVKESYNGESYDIPVVRSTTVYNNPAHILEEKTYMMHYVRQHTIMP